MPEINDPLYYLRNFETVLDWIRDRYQDLLTTEELRFIHGFYRVPVASRALLVRMVMRKGDLFRESRLVYGEIGQSREAAQPLILAGWVDAAPHLTPEQLAGQLTLPELRQHLSHWLSTPRGNKSELQEQLIERADVSQTLENWCPTLDDRIYRLEIGALADRFRLMFFGNLHQDWREFVLTELGLYRYETVPLTRASRAFDSRNDIDDYLDLHALREALETRITDPRQARDHLLDQSFDNPWLQQRLHRLCFELGRAFERTDDPDSALALYRHCKQPEARFREIRVLESQRAHDEALSVAEGILGTSGNEVERQAVQRVIPRLRRALGKPPWSRPAMPSIPTRTLEAPFPGADTRVEQAAAVALQEDSGGIVHYAENALITGMFGLLCWDAFFEPLPGAFFHPFQGAPADFGQPDFVQRRQPLFDSALSSLDGRDYPDLILQRYDEKFGIQAPLVNWNVLSRALLKAALACIPADHLRLWFQRLMMDPRENRSGLPDLVQLWPGQKAYRMIEVKGPGDRLQSNQKRWLDYAIRHELPVLVCHVRWSNTGNGEATAAS